MGVMNWLAGGDLPKTIVDSYFNPMRLLMLQSRRSAAYKGIMALIMKNHSRDFISGQEMDFVRYKADGIDIHHIFPKNYLVKHGYDKSKYNRIANFVHLRNDINISVSDLAPREYLGDILSGGNNHHSDIVNEAEMINNFEDNAIPKILLQAEVDDYDEFLRQRQVLMADMVREYYKTL